VEIMVFDWHKAASIIKNRTPQQASVGLYSDLGYTQGGRGRSNSTSVFAEFTGGHLYFNGAPVKMEDAHSFLVRSRSVPEIEVDGAVEECVIERSKTPGWGQTT